MKKKNFKKVLALLLTLMMFVVTLSVPMTASAEAEKNYLSQFTVDFANASPANVWQHYYIPDSSLGSDMYWDVGARAWIPYSDAIARSNQGQYLDSTGNLVDCSGIADSTHDISLLTYIEKSYNNFELDVSWKCVVDGNGMMIVGFGKKDLTKYANHVDGGMALLFDKNANVKLQTAQGVTDVAAAPASAACNNLVNLKLVVDDGIADITINGEYVTTFILPENYDGFVSLGASRSAGSHFNAFTIKEIATEGALRMAQWDTGWWNTPDWTPYGSINVLESPRIFNSMNMGAWGWLYYGDALVRTLADKKANEWRVDEYTIDHSIYSSTYNVDLFSYNGRTYEDFILDMVYEATEHVNPNSYVLIGFGRDNPLEYATGKDGGFALEVQAGSGNVALRSYEGATPLSTNAPNTAERTKNVAVKLIVKEGVATVYVNGICLATYDLPEDYDGIISFGATSANWCKIKSFAVNPLDEADRKRNTANLTNIFSDSNWTPYWSGDAASNPELSQIDPGRSWIQSGTGLVRVNQDTDANGNAYNNTNFAPTSNVAMYTYNAKQYQNAIIKFQYVYSQHTYADAKILIGFGRKDPTKYATHEDGGMVLELGNITQMVMRNSKTAVNGVTQWYERDDTIIDVTIVIDNWQATVICDNMPYLTCDLPNDYSGYISFGATGAHYSEFRHFSILELDNDVLGDVTGDDEIDVLDFIRLKKSMVSADVDTHSPADFDEDGSVNASDLLLLKQYLLGTINKF